MKATFTPLLFAAGQMRGRRPLNLRKAFRTCALAGGLLLGAVPGLAQTPPAIVPSAFTFTTLAGKPGGNGSTDGTGAAARFSFPSGAAVDGAGNVFVTDTGNNTIRRITPDGVVTTLAGLAGVSGTNDGTGSAARFNNPWGIALDRAGNVFISDASSHTIRKVTPVGTNWSVTTLAGQAGKHGIQDGTGTAAQFDVPRGLAVDSAGNLYVADSANSMIRKVTPSGAVTTLAGRAQTPGFLDGAGNAARFSQPYALAVDNADTIYVTDILGNEAIRLVTPAGAVTTMSLLPLLSSAEGLAVDGAGNVYFADNTLSTIGKVTSGGLVIAVAGLKNSPGVSDGTGSDARFGNPIGLAVDKAGNLYVADLLNSLVRKGTPAPVVFNLKSGPSLSLVGAPSQTAVMEASSDLLNWQPVWTNTFNISQKVGLHYTPVSSLTFTDTSSGSTNRYYRAITP